MIDVLELRYGAEAVWLLLRVQFWGAMWWFGVPASEIPPDVRHALEVISIYDHGHRGEER